MILLRHGQSQFNAVFSVSRIDPGIIDPELTEDGHRQIASVVDDLRGHAIEQVFASPYRRTLQSAQIVAEALDLPVRVEPIVRERAFFTCDIGTPRSDLSQQWPHFDFADLAEVWWPAPEESEDEVSVRCDQFRRHAAGLENWERVLVVTHWGFIRGLTGQEVANAAILRFDPHEATAVDIVSLDQV